MKKLVYAAMLLLGLSMMVSCGGGSSYSNSYEGNESSSANYSSGSSNSTTTFSYQSDIMAYLRSHKFVASNGDRLTFTNSSIRNGSSEIGVTNFEVLGWDSQTALLSAHTPYGTPPINIYVYAAEGHIVIDDIMYFAK